MRAVMEWRSGSGGSSGAEKRGPQGIDPVSAMFEVAEKTINNRNSMLQDIEKGKPTEIMFLNGKIAEWGVNSKYPPQSMARSRP